MLQPALLAAIRDLEFVARTTVEGALAGLHRSPFHGYSAEFLQYRHYRPGDDLKHVDWKLLARTDRVYTKQYRETTNLQMRIALDASASMRYAADGTPSKIDYARVIAASLAYLVVDQGDAVGLSIHDDTLRVQTGARAGRKHLRSVLATLSRVEASGSSAPGALLRRIVDGMRSRGALAIISDLYDQQDAVAGELRRAARMGHDVIVFHVLSPDETTWRWPEDVELEDSESGERLAVSADVAAEFKARAAAFVREWERRCVSSGVQYVLASTDVAPDRSLRRWLVQRGSRGR